MSLYHNTFNLYNREYRHKFLIETLLISNNNESNEDSLSHNSIVSLFVIHKIRRSRRYCKDDVLQGTLRPGKRTQTPTLM